MGTSTIVGGAGNSAGKEVPSLDDLDYVNLSSIASRFPIKNNGITVLVFWATWCRESRSVISDLNRIFAKYKKRDVEFLGITAEAKTTVEAFLRRKIGRMSFPCAVDPSGKVARACCVKKTPTASICDGGKVVWSGVVTEGGLDKALAVALHERGGGSGTGKRDEKAIKAN